MDHGKFSAYRHVGDKKVAGAILREQRLVQNMTQRQVAVKAKISIQQYQKFENGARNIWAASFELTGRVLEALSMDVAAFFHGSYFDEEPRG